MKNVEMDVAKSNWIDHGKDIMTRIILIKENELTGMENHGTQLELYDRDTKGTYRINGHYNLSRYHAEIDFMARVNSQLRIAGYFIWSRPHTLYEPKGVDRVTSRV